MPQTRREIVRAERAARKPAPVQRTLPELPRTPKATAEQRLASGNSGIPLKCELEPRRTGRLCGACSEPLDREGHERKVVDVVDDDGTIVGKERVWVCRVRRLVDQTAPMLDSDERKVIRTYVPGDDENQRTKANNLRWVPTRALAARA